MNPPLNARPVIGSQRLYRCLLAAYPRRHRTEYGAAMLQLFRDQCRDAWSQSRWGGLTRLWLRVAPDLVKTSFIEHLANLNTNAIMLKNIFDSLRPASAASRAFIGVTVFVFLFLWLIATVVTFILPETYASRALIEVTKYKAANPTPGPSAPNSSPESYDPYFIQTECEIIRTRIVLEGALYRLNPAQRKTFGVENDSDIGNAVAILKQVIEIKPIPNTSLVQITVYHRDKNMAAQLANAITGSYVDRSRDVRNMFERDPVSAKEMGSGSMPAVWVVETADPSSHPARPDKLFNIALGGVISMLFAIGVGMVVAKLVDRVTRNTPELSAA